ncbi:hypothetical protein OSTOST_12260 [Ostertagia ostertagi]
MTAFQAWNILVCIRAGLQVLQNRNEQVALLFDFFSERTVNIRRIVLKDQKRALNSLTLHLVLFFWSWCITVFGIELCGDFLHNWLPNAKLVETLQSYMVSLLRPPVLFPVLLPSDVEVTRAFDRVQGTTTDTFVLLSIGFSTQSEDHAFGRQSVTNS